MEPTFPESTTSRPARNKAVRPWIFGALFVWALTGAVALSAFSSRSETKTAPLVLEPVATSAPALALATAPVLAPLANSDRKIAWETTFEGAMQRARVENKPIMIDFYTDWCGWCKELDRQVFPDKAVVSESQNWVSIRINAEKRPDVAGAYGVTGYPTIVFAQGSGKPLDILAGFAPPVEFAATMRAAREKLASSSS